MLAQLHRLREREPDYRRLDEIVEEATAVTCSHAVGYLQDQAALAAHHERGGVVARDNVRLDPLPQHGDPVFERELPERRVELRQGFPTPDVVDEHVEPTVLLFFDALKEPAYLLGTGVIHPHGDGPTTSRLGHLRSLLDCLRPS